MKAILGDNQFYGINHNSTFKSNEYKSKFNNNESILNVIRHYFKCNGKEFCFTTHDKLQPIIKEIIESNIDIKLSPCLPYAHKFADAITQKGIGSFVKDYVNIGDIKLMSSLIGGINNSNIDSIIRKGLQMELKYFEIENYGTIYLQNTFTDLLLGVGAFDIINSYINIINEDYKLKAGLITCNLKTLSDNILHNNIKNLFVH